MRIARPKRPAAEFKRKRGPPPQATKLLRFSLISGIVFMVLLGIVFLPRMLVEQTPVATPVMMVVTDNATRVFVTSVGSLVSLSKLNASFHRDNVTVATLGPPLGDGNGTFSFVDADGDGSLGPGDYFALISGPTSCQRLDISQRESGSTFLVGQKEWGACSST